MIERYVYAVTKRLPEAQRQDVADELRGLIEDMLNERVQGRDITEEDVEEVLLELGNPRNLARQYRDTKKYVIGPELYDLYILVLKIALISVVTVSTAVFIIQIILNPINTLDYFINYIVSFITTTIPIVFGWTTLAFALAEYFGEDNLKKLNIDKEKLNLDKEWKPENLAPIPDPKRQIKRSEPIIGIIFYVLIIMILAFSNDYFGIWIFQDGEFSTVVPFLNEETYGSFLILILIVFGFGIVKECLKFRYEKWTYTLVIFTAIVNLISIAMIMFMITGAQFWNPNFMNELIQYGFVTEASQSYESIRLIWEQLTLWTLILLIFGLLLDIAIGWFKVRKAK
ncbi:HAAS signaling domain-containing protein [Lentibacillus halodurans]